jgi:hypothetical protein
MSNQSSTENNEKTTDERRAMGGFQDNPQNINRNGRPPKGYSISDMFKSMLSERPDVKNGLADAILEKALKGDVTAQKLIWNYMDGMPQQKMDHTGEVQHTISYQEALKVLKDDEATVIKSEESG